MTWPTARLGDLVQRLGGGTPSRKVPEYWGTGVPWFTVADLSDDSSIQSLSTSREFITDLGLNSSAAQLIPKGAVVFSTRVVVGKVGIAENALATNQDFSSLISKNAELLFPRFLGYYLLQARASLRRHQRGLTISGITTATLDRLPVPLPAPSEQRRIVEILDQADNLRRLRAQAHARANRILPALFIEMFGDPVTNPMAWPMERFADICESRLGKMLDAKQQTGENKFPYLRNANVYWDRLDLTEVFEMDFDEADREEFRLRNGDLLICEGGEVGRCAIWRDELPECYFQKALHRVRPKNGRAVSEYLLYLLWELSRRGGLSDATSKVTFAHLTGVKLKGMIVPVAPFRRQQEFAQLVRATKPLLMNGALSSERLQSLFTLVLNSAFSGDLTAPWRDARMKELLAEMDQQTKTLESMQL